MSDLWSKLCQPSTLKKGWHLARVDVKQDFIDVPFLVEEFAPTKSMLDRRLTEISRQLKSRQFVHFSAIRADIPKSAFSSRPATFIPLGSRIVLFAALYLVAKDLDKELPEAVYSCRVKSNIDKKLFKNPDSFDAPFIKKVDVDDISPFNDWPSEWPAYQEQVVEALNDGYTFMATSDISAYFENIQLEILRDKLLDQLPNDQAVSNFFIDALASWTSENRGQRHYMRGIPQGTDVSRFLGNFFLLPIDLSFTNGTIGDVRYYRYMDDIRIFTKDFDTARASLFKFEEGVRELHLNLQSAKTAILTKSEIQRKLLDSRSDVLDNCNDRMKNEETPEGDVDDIRNKIWSTFKMKPSADGYGEQKISGARKPLTGLTDRVFRRAIGMLIHLEDDRFVNRLVAEVAKNKDIRLTRLLIRSARIFPRREKIFTGLRRYLESDTDSYSVHKAFVIKAFRYLSQIPEDFISTMMKKHVDSVENTFIAAEILLLAARSEYNSDWQCDARKIYLEHGDIELKRSAALVLARQKGGGLEKFIRGIAGHPNTKLRMLGDYFVACYEELEAARRVVERAFHKDLPWLLCDYIPLLNIISESPEVEIRWLLLDKLATKKAARPSKKCVRIGLRPVLEDFENRIKAKL